MKGGVVATGKHIRILGHGVLDGRDFPRFKGPTRYPILLERCDHVEIRGIIIRDSWSWTLVPRGSSNILISNLKMACSKGENSDGIDVENSQHVRIEKCFLRTDDDVFSTKGFSEARDTTRPSRTSWSRIASSGQTGRTDGGSARSAARRRCGTCVLRISM